MMRKLSVALMLVTVLSLNAILLIVDGVGTDVMGHNKYFGLLVNVMYLGLIVSSLLQAYLNWQQHRVIWTAVFLANLLLVLVPMTLKVAGLTTISPLFLVGLDLYWLNLYIFYLAAYSTKASHSFKKR